LVTTQQTDQYVNGFRCSVGAMKRRTADQLRLVLRLIKLICFTVVIFIIVVLLSRSTTSVQYVYSDFTSPQLNTSELLFSTKPLVIWSSDFHSAPINDLKHLLRPLGVRFIDKSVSLQCYRTNTCEGRKTLKVINVRNAVFLHPSLIPKFYEAYKEDAEMKSVDAFVCFHPAAMCELFMPFNKSIIVIATTRYELGRFGRYRWKKWNNNLVKIAKSKTNVVGGNNLYDVEYVKYFTGIQGQLLPSVCVYVTTMYTPTRSEFLLSRIRGHGFAATFIREYEELCKNMSCNKLTSLRQKYRYYNYTDLVTYAGTVYIPYQVSVMSMFEQYRMNIPLFFPSLDLLTTWQHKHMVSEKQ